MNNISGLTTDRNKAAFRTSKQTAQGRRSRIDDLAGYMVCTGEIIREAFRQATLNKKGFVIVVDKDNKTLGIVTDGDFRRAIWEGVSLEKPIESIMNTKYIFLTEGYTLDNVKNIFLTTNIRQIPILDEGTLVDVIFRRDINKLEPHVSKPCLSLPVVIMAGGRGARLDPFTRILPKPLIPIGDKPIIEIIIDKFAEFGVTDFYISVNHKQKMIQAFFEDFHSKYTISYINEEHFLGTAGALKYLEGKFDTPFIVSNCDIIIDTDYARINKFHQQGRYDLTLVGSMQHHTIPYGVCRLRTEGELWEIEEKPEYDLLANTGLYILNPEVLSFIPQGKHFDMTELIQGLQDEGKRIGVYPVSGESWIDVGQWEEYKKAIEKLSRFG